MDALLLRILGVILADVLAGKTPAQDALDVLNVLGSAGLRLNPAVLKGALDAAGKVLAHVAAMPGGPPGDPDAGGNARAEQAPLFIDQEPQRDPKP